MFEHKSFSFGHWPNGCRYRVAAQLLECGDALVTVDDQKAAARFDDDDRRLLADLSQRSDQPTLARVGVLIGGLAVALVMAWFSQPGKRFIAYGRESYEETKRVVWPSRKETLTTTGIVFAFVVVMAILLFVVDKSLEWFLYDMLLSWR